MKQPSFVAILCVFNTGIGVKVIYLEGKKSRSLPCPLMESHKNTGYRLKEFWKVISSYGFSPSCIIHPQKIQFQGMYYRNIGK